MPWNNSNVITNPQSSALIICYHQHPPTPSPHPHSRISVTSALKRQMTTPSPISITPPYHTDPSTITPTHPKLISFAFPMNMHNLIFLLIWHFFHAHLKKVLECNNVPAQASWGLLPHSALLRTRDFPNCPMASKKINIFTRLIRQKIFNG